MINKVKAFCFTLVGLATLASCSEEPDTSLFDPDQLTIAEIIRQDPNLSGFYRILEKGNLASYIGTSGEYSCFAPANEGVSKYIDSLYYDQSYLTAKNKKIHNGIREAGNDFSQLSLNEKIELMSDSLCEDISRFHICGSKYVTSELEETSSWISILNSRPIKAQPTASGSTLNGALIVDANIEAINGVLHKINRVIPRNDRTMDDQLSVESDLSIFFTALQATGLKDSLSVDMKRNAAGDPITYDLSTNHADRDGNLLYYPKTCQIKWTVFAETNDVFMKEGIDPSLPQDQILEKLRQKCSAWYKNCSGWYDYVSEKGIQVSDGTDYENEWNVVHMFVAYHILRAGMPIDRIVYEKNQDSGKFWNFCFGYEPQEYFETLLANTLLKVWETNPKTSKNLWLNRYLTNNTLTHQIGMFAADGDGIHDLVPLNTATGTKGGVRVDRDNSVITLNGYIHRIKDILIYDARAKECLNERLRLDSSTFLYELINNGLRGATPNEVSVKNSGGDGNRVAFHNQFFDNIVAYNPGTLLRFNVMGEWRAHNSDQFQGWDVYDFAIKLPHVPTGEYELRIIYPPMGKGGLMQFYLGNSSRQQDMIAVGIPFDACANPYETPSIGYVDVVAPATPEEMEIYDWGVSSDQEMKVRGYMRAPASFSRATYNTMTDRLTYSEGDIYSAARNISDKTSCRTESGYGTMMLRRVITTQKFEQSKDYWLRIKNLINDKNLGWSFDFVELVPVSVANSQTYTEDWY